MKLLAAAAAVVAMSTVAGVAGASTTPNTPELTGPVNTGSVIIEHAIAWQDRMPMICDETPCARSTMKTLVVKGTGRCVQRAWAKTSVEADTATVRLRVARGKCATIGEVLATVRIPRDVHYIVDAKTGEKTEFLTASAR